MAPCLPAITVVIPILNEAASVRHCLEAVLQQDYPADRLEILVVDGGSLDDTPAIVQALLQNRPRARLLDNPRRLRSAGLNVGILAAQGEIVIFVDGHTLIAPDYVKACVRCLVEQKADNAGGGMRPVGTTYTGQGIALATSSRFGVGNSKFHYSNQEAYVDTVYLGAYWRKTFDQIGLYDETLQINADYELNYRLRQAGGRILLSPTIRSTYIPRSSLMALWRQYFRYGRGKVDTLHKHPASLRWRQTVAPLFVATLLGSLLLSSFAKPARAVLGAATGSYLLANSIASTIAASRGGWRYLPLLPLVFAIIHIAWGLGFWWGVGSLYLAPRR
jgi:glycosyltransferase involved in cell wall biosynthesis